MPSSIMGGSLPQRVVPVWVPIKIPQVPRKAESQGKPAHHLRALGNIKSHYLFPVLQSVQILSKILEEPSSGYDPVLEDKRE